MTVKKHDGHERAVSDEMVADIVRRIVKVAQPEKIILFGSAARSEMGPNSDIDVLVVKSGPVHRGRLTEAIYMNLLGLGHAVDVDCRDTGGCETLRGGILSCPGASVTGWEGNL